MANCYNNGTIYKLCCKDITIKDIYVGSTCAFRMRKNSHKSVCNNENNKNYNLPVYKFIRDHGGFSNWDMIEIKKFNCETKRELEKEERAVLEMIGGTLNTLNPIKTEEEKKEYATTYSRANREPKKKTSKAHYESNKKEILEIIKEKFNCDCGGKFTLSHKSRHIKSKKHQKYLKSNLLLHPL